MNVDEDYLHIVARDFRFDCSVIPCEPETLRDAIINFPLTHSGGSMLDGDRPSEGDLDIIQLQDPSIDDNGLLRYAIQEPFDQFAGGQFYITTQHPPQPAYASPDPLGTYGGVQDHVRLAATYRDASGVLTPIFRDMPMPTSGDWHYNGGWIDVSVSPQDVFIPATPVSTWEISTVSSKFDSGVLARDASDNEFKIFAGHHVVISDGEPTPEPVDHTEFRWYVIDPDLANFPGASWAPLIEVVGRAPVGSIPDGETYQGAISVNQLGAAYITFTRSGPSGAAAFPSLVRAKLAANYTTVLTELPSSGEQGPLAWFGAGSSPINTLGLDYADIQPDPNTCGFWAVGTLVADPGDHDPPVESDARSIWLTEIPVNCNNAEMNGDGVVDAADLALFLDYYTKEDPRADMDRSGTITTADYQRYSGEYAKR